MGLNIVNHFHCHSPYCKPHILTLHNDEKLAVFVISVIYTVGVKENCPSDCFGYHIVIASGGSEDDSLLLNI